MLSTQRPAAGVSERAADAWIAAQLSVTAAISEDEDARRDKRSRFSLAESCAQVLPAVV